MPTGDILTGKMLLHLARWPTLLGTSDDGLQCLMKVLSIPADAFPGSGEEIYHRILEAYAKDAEEVQCIPFHGKGALLRSCIAAFRSGILATYEQQDASNDSRFDVTYDEWIKKIWDSLHKTKKIKNLDETTIQILRTKQTTIDVYFDLEHFESTVRGLVIPNGEKSISHLVLKTAWEGEYYDSVSGDKKYANLREALQLDSYYATMVRGACVKIPLTPDIWCSHDEMQHTGEETQHFFKVMWEVRSCCSFWFAFIRVIQ